MNVYAFSNQVEPLKIIVVTGPHEEYVLDNFKEFGFSHVGEVKLAPIFKRGWVRVRTILDEITMETGRLDAKTAGNIKSFCEKSDYSPDMKVVIQVTEPLPEVMRVTVKEVLEGKLKKPKADLKYNESNASR